MVTIAEVAALAKASTAAVSHVFNQRPGKVGAAKRQKILDAADKLGYRPSRRARQVRKQANLVLAVQIDSSITTSNAWRSSSVLSLVIAQGINDYASRHGYHINLLIPAGGRDFHEITGKLFKENAVDGAVFFGLVEREEGQLETLLAELQRFQMPAVTLSRTLSERGLPYVGVDLRGAIHELTGRIHEYGHRQIAYVGATQRQRFQQSEWTSRFDLVVEGLRDHGLAPAEDNVVETVDEIGAYQATLTLAGRADPPTCIVYSGDHLAMAGIRALQEAGRRVPNDISVVSFDNAPYVHESLVPLTTIDQFAFRRGETLAKVLIDRIQNPDASSSSIHLIAAELVERQSLTVCPA